MLRRLGTLLVCLAMFSIAGGHWAVLQSIAWAGMVQDYARADGLVVAVQKTFSGQYPCALCKKVAEARQQEQTKPALAKLDKKAEGFLHHCAATGIFPPAPDYFLPLPSDRLPASIVFDPPQPVPRAA